MGDTTESKVRADEDQTEKRRGRPQGYVFGGRTATAIEGASLSGSEEEREARAGEREHEARMEQAARTQDWRARLAGMSSDGRLEETLACLGRRASFSRVLTALLEHCREERDSLEAEEFVSAQPDFEANRQSPRRYALLLMRTGALEETAYDADGNVVPEQDEVALQAADASGEEAQADLEDDEVQAELAGEEAQPCLEGKEASASGSSAPGPASGEPVAWKLRTTDVGLAALERRGPRTRIRTLLDAQGQDRFEAYLQLLEYCEEPRTLAQVTELLAESPGLERDAWGVPRMQPSGYVGKLDEAGALEWKGGWLTTQAARVVLSEL